MSHFHAIGFQIEGREQFGQLMADLAGQAVEQPADPEHGRTLLWSDDHVQVWFHPDANWCIVPAFNSQRRFRVMPTAWRPSPDGCPFCAMLDVEVLGDEPGAVAFPLCVTAGDIRLLMREIALGTSIELGLTLFAESVEPITTDDNAGTDHDLASQITNHLWRGGVFPLGPFNAVGQRRDTPRARVNGELLTLDTLTNTHSSKDFHRLEIGSTGGIWEAVAAPTNVESLKVGHRLSITGWVCATL